MDHSFQRKDCNPPDLLQESLGHFGARSVTRVPVNPYPLNLGG